MKKNFLSKSTALAAVVCVSAGLTGCAEWNKRCLDSACDKGSAFTSALAEEYRMLGETEQLIMYDSIDANLWFRKGRSARRGCAVLPECPKKWRIREAHIPELVAARDRLIIAVEHGAGHIAPEMTAHAQVHYDCWVEQTEEGWQYDDIRACRAEYYKAMHEVEDMLFDNVIQGPSAHAVLFRLGKYNLSGEAHRVIDEAVQDASTHEVGHRIRLVGHTDKIGSRATNKKLAMNRLRSVRDELVHRGVPAHMIDMKVVGESNKSGYIDPDYRRVDILFLARRHSHGT